MAFSKGMRKAHKEKKVELSGNDKEGSSGNDAVKQMRDSGGVFYMLWAVALLLAYTFVKYFVEHKFKPVMTVSLALGAGFCVYRVGNVMNDLGWAPDDDEYEATKEEKKED